jgi:cyclopropane fatty-acyl-phospholipid synthase-like methyltransferase
LILLLSNLLKLFLSALRRNDLDVINLYNSLSGLMQITTGGNMLNFGYWDGKTQNPLHAQYTLSKMIGEFASLQTARRIIDVGSGYSAPARQWTSQYNFVKILCVNINLQQLKVAAASLNSNSQRIDLSVRLFSLESLRNNNNNVFHINATSTRLPIRNKFVDRVIAFESAQHFKPFVQFIQESNRVLEHSGLVILAMPVITYTSKLLSLPLFTKLGILSVTWASEHYKLEYVKSMIRTHGFEIKDIQYIGSNVYGQLATYYIENREKLKKMIFREYPKFLETILYKSLLGMKDASRNGVIDYILLKAKKHDSIKCGAQSQSQL